MTTQTTAPTCCPHCRHDHLYLLGDGRYKCGACLRKFSAGGRRSRLTAGAMEAIVAGFAAGTPALAVSTATGLNPKTVQLYYGRVRELLAMDRERELACRYGSGLVSAGLFSGFDGDGSRKHAVPIGCLVVRDRELELLFVGDDGGGTARLESTAVAGWLVAADRRAMEQLQLDRINCLAAGSARERVRGFWMNAKRRLAAYCGGFRQHFRLYLREMEFRGNMESAAAAREHVGALLERNTITPTGENDA